MADDMADDAGDDEEDGAVKDEPPIRRRDPSFWGPCPHRRPQRGAPTGGGAHGGGVDDSRRRCDRGRTALFPSTPALARLAEPSQRGVRAKSLIVAPGWSPHGNV